MSEEEKQLEYYGFCVAAVDSNDGEFLTESINSFVELGGKLHTVVPKVEGGTTTDYLVLMEFRK